MGAVAQGLRRLRRRHLQDRRKKVAHCLWAVRDQVHQWALGAWYVAPRALLTALAQVAGQCPTNRHPKDVACEAARCYELSRLPHCAYRLVPTRPCRVTRNPSIGLDGNYRLDKDWDMCMLARMGSFTL